MTSGKSLLYPLPDVADPDQNDTWTITAHLGIASSFITLQQTPSLGYILVFTPRLVDVGIHTIELELKDQRKVASKSSKYQI
jgi:hypothetical protein